MQLFHEEIVVAKKLTQKQVAGMKTSNRHGDILANDHPEIANLWRDGATYEQLALKYLPNTCLEMGVEMGVSIVKCAMKKLIPQEEKIAIARCHWQRAARDVGIASKKNKTGIFGMTEEQLYSARQKGNRASLYTRGLALYNDNVKLTPLGPMTEEDYIKKLIGLRQENKDCTWEKIAEFANAIFGNNRNGEALRIAFMYGSRG